MDMQIAFAHNMHTIVLQHNYHARDWFQGRTPIKPEDLTALIIELCPVKMVPNELLV